MVRFKNRFLALEIHFVDHPAPNPGPALSNSHLINSIRSSLSRHFGISASGALGGPLSIKYYSPQTRTILLRCARVGVETVHAACSLLGELAGKKCRVDVVGTSGTIKKLEQWVIRRDRKIVQVAQRTRKVREKRGKKGSKKRQQVSNGPHAEEDTGMAVA